MEIDDNILIFDELDVYGEILNPPQEEAGPSGGESRYATASSAVTAVSVPESTFSDTFPPAKREKIRHFLSAADINDMGKNAE